MFYLRLVFILIPVVTTWSNQKSSNRKERKFQIKQKGEMVNDMQIVFQSCPVGPLEGVPDKIYLDELGAYVNGQPSGIHRNEDCGKLG